MAGGTEGFLLLLLFEATDCRPPAAAPAFGASAALSKLRGLSRSALRLRAVDPGAAGLPVDRPRDDARTGTGTVIPPSMRCAWTPAEGGIGERAGVGTFLEVGGLCRRAGDGVLR